MVQVRHRHGPPMNLGNMREQGVRGLSVTCPNHACRHDTVVNVDSYPHEVEVPSILRRRALPMKPRTEFSYVLSLI